MLNFVQWFFSNFFSKCVCITTDSFLLSLSTNDIVKDSQNLNDFFDFSNLYQNNELLRNKKNIRKAKIETPKDVYMDEFSPLRS